MQFQIHGVGKKVDNEFREVAEVGLDFQAVRGNTCGFGRELPESKDCGLKTWNEEQKGPCS